MSWRNEYKAKLCSPEEAAKTIKSGDRVFSVSYAPFALVNAIGERYNELEDVWMVGDSYDQPVNFYTPERMNGHFHRICTFYRNYEREAKKNGCDITAAIVQYHKQHDFYTNIVKPNVALLNVSPPDENGYCSLGLSPVDVEYVLPTAKVVIGQINKYVPRICSDHGYVHVSDMTHIIEHDEPLASFPTSMPSEVDKALAAHIVDRIPNGACIQLGIGAAPNAVGYSLGNHRDLGIHSEMYVEAMMYLTKNGAVSNSRKALYRGQSVFGFGSGSQELYDFMDNNYKVFCKPMEWITSPFTIAQIDNFVSINTCFGTDVLGQISSESLGYTHYSGIGGQLDFVRGAQYSKGGMSFLAFRSTSTKRDGTVISKVVFNHSIGTAISTPRTDVQFIATEYGIADIQHQPIDERVKRIIAVAHPDFRDELMFQAKKHSLII